MVVVFTGLQPHDRDLLNLSSFFGLAASSTLAAYAEFTS